MENPQVILSWNALLRPYVKRNPNVFRFYLAMSFIIAIIIAILGDWILIIPIASLLFLFYVLTTTPPPEIENKITKFGIETAGTTLRWSDLSHFYFTERFGYTIVVLVTHAPYFFHTYLIVPDEEIKKKLIEELSHHIIYQDKPKKTFVDRMAEKLSQLFSET